MHVSILDHFRHLNIDLSRSLKVKCESGIGLPIYDFLLVFNNNIRPNSAALQDIGVYMGYIKSNRPNHVNRPFWRNDLVN